MFLKSIAALVLGVSTLYAFPDQGNDQNNTYEDVQFGQDNGSFDADNSGFEGLQNDFDSADESNFDVFENLPSGEVNGESFDSGAA